MSTDAQGKKDYFFAIGGKDNIEYSSPVSKATITICGKETFATVDAANSETYKEQKNQGSSEKTVVKETYKTWFNFEAGANSDDKCGVITYRLVD